MRLFGRRKRLEIRRLHLRPGDIVVLSTEELLSADEAAHIKAEARKLIPGHEVVLLTGGLKLPTVLQPHAVGPAVGKAIASDVDWKRKAA